MEKFKNLKVKMVPNKLEVEVKIFNTEPEMQFKLTIQKFLELLSYSKFEHNVLYGEYELMLYRNKKSLYAVGSPEHMQAALQNELKDIKNPVKNLEVGKLYHSNIVSCAGKQIYMYIGTGYYFQCGGINYLGEKYFGYPYDTEIHNGDCFIAFNLDNYGTCLASDKGSAKMSREATPEEIKFFGGNDKFDKVKDLIDVAYIVGDKEYVDSKMEDAKLKGYI